MTAASSQSLAAVGESIFFDTRRPLFHIPVTNALPAKGSLSTQHSRRDRWCATAGSLKDSSERCCLKLTGRMKGDDRKEQDTALDKAKARTVSSFQNLEAGGLCRGVASGGNVGGLYDLTVESSV